MTLTLPSPQQPISSWQPLGSQKPARIPLIWILGGLTLWLCCGCGAGKALSGSQDIPLAEAPAPAETSLGQRLPLVTKAIIGEYEFLLEAAVTPQQQSMGLMYRESLDPDRGMVFPYDPPIDRVGYWMLNVPISLDIIFIADGEVVDIADNVPPCTRRPSECPVYGPDPGHPPISAVLELAGGRAVEIGLEPGDPVQFEWLADPLPHDFRE